MTVEHVGPGGVSNSYGVRTTTSKVVYENDNTYQDVFIPTGSVPVTATPSATGPVFLVGDTAYKFDTPAYSWAGKPAAASANNGQAIRITDIGIAGSVWISNSSVWRPINGRIVLSRGQGLVAAPLSTLSGTTGKLAIPSGTGIVGGSYVVPAGLLQPGFGLQVTAKVKKTGTGGAWSIAARIGSTDSATDAAIASANGAATDNNDVWINEIADIVSNTSLISATFAVPNQPTTGAFVDKNGLNMLATQYVGLWIGSLNAADSVKLLSYEIALIG